MSTWKAGIMYVGGQVSDPAVLYQIQWSTCCCHVETPFWTQHEGHITTVRPLSSFARRRRVASCASTAASVVRHVHHSGSIRGACRWAAVLWWRTCPTATGAPLRSSSGTRPAAASLWVRAHLQLLQHLACAPARDGGKRSSSVPTMSNGASITEALCCPRRHQQGRDSHRPEH